MTVRLEHVSATLSDLYTEDGHKVGSVAVEGGQPVLYTSHSIRLTLQGLRELLQAMQSRQLDYEYGS